MEYGYARVSSIGQNLDRQLEAFKNLGIEKKRIYHDKQSGKDFERINYQKMLKKLKENDILYIKSIDRLGRNYDMILKEWHYITKIIKADIVVLDMPLLDTRCKEDNLTGKLISDIVLQLLSYVAETERSFIKERQAEGIKIAKDKGIKFGRPTKNYDEFEQIFFEYNKHNIPLQLALEKTGLKQSNFYYQLHKYGY